MNPDTYMLYDGNDVESACKGFRPDTKWAYVCALWHYWHHTHCTGLPNRDDSLRLICEVEPASWARIKGLIFAPPYFELDGGRWHHKEFRALYADLERNYQAKVAAAAVARGETESVTGSVTRSVTKPVTEPKKRAR